MHPACWQHDKLETIYEIFEEFNENCRKFLVPDDSLSLDETLFVKKMQISFKQLNSSKPAKYGLHKPMKACCYSFTFSNAVYSGKPKAEPTSYYTPGTTQIGKIPN